MKSLEKKKSFLSAMKGAPIGLLGQVNSTRKLVVKGLKGKTVVSSGIDALKNSWQRPFKRIMHEKS